MYSLRNIRAVVAAVGVISVAASFAQAAQTAQKYRPPVADLEVSQDEPMPAGFSVQPTDVDGPVFVDSRGMTLYTWPSRGLVGDRRDKPSNCTDKKLTETAGRMSIYPAGLVLPDLDTRPTCLQQWPAVLAEPDAKPVGRWSISVREDGRKQWAYNGLPLYTFALDTKPGQVNGGFTRTVTDGDAPTHRVPAGPPAAHPPGFKVQTVATGRILENGDGDVIYALATDGPNQSKCKDECLKQWTPMLASEIAQPQGEWGVVERSPGVKQWTFRKMPLYTYAFDRRRTIVGMKGVSLIGNDVPGARPVYTQKWPDPPKEFKVQDSRVGQVLADKNGMTLYTYVCADDAADELVCDHPSQTQAYRLMICGRGDAAACNRLFAYVPAPKDAKVNNLIWGTAWIDPQTGHYAKPDAPGAMHVWTFRDRPIYTHGRDKKPGDAYGDAWGENDGVWNGYKAMWIRDDFNGNAD